MAESGVKREKKKYNLPNKEFAKRKISEMVIAGYTNQEISTQLSIPKRSVERYVAELYEEDNQLLERPTQEQRATAVSIFLSQVSETNREILEIARDPEQDGQTRLNAYDLRVDLLFSALKLKYGGPEWLARRLSNIKSNPLVAEQKGLQVTLVKNEKELPSHYDIVATNDNNNNEK